MLLLLYSGLRISDALQLKRSQLNRKTGQLFLRVMKSGENLYLELQTPAMTALNALPVEGECFFWWQGEGRLESAIDRARRMIQRACDTAGVENGHPHRFRDTFAKTLLVNGVSIRTVSLLLGHSSVKITEKHYAAYVQEYQEALEQSHP